MFGESFEHLTYSVEPMFDTWSELETFAWDAGDKWIHRISPYNPYKFAHTMSKIVQASQVTSNLGFAFVWFNSIGIKQIVSSLKSVV